MQNKLPDPIDFGEIVMDEMGLYTDQLGRVVDQETDNLLLVKGKCLKFTTDDSIQLSKNEMAFDPLNNQTLANSLFGFYLNNRFNDSGDAYVSTYATVANPEDKTKGTLEVHIDGADTMVSGEYHVDSVKYLDMMMRMNGTPDINLEEFDVVNPKTNTKKK